MFKLLLFLPLLASFETLEQRINAHLLIGDPKSAAMEAKAAFEYSTKSVELYQVILKSLAANGEDGEMMKIWDQMHSRFPEEAYQTQLLEEMCWGVLQKGKNTASMNSQLINMIAAALTQDMRAVPFLLSGLHHSNAHMRALAVELATHYKDLPLKQEIERLFYTEKIQNVRLEVIKAIGKLKLHHLRNDLLQIVSSPKKGDKEKLAAIVSLVNLSEEIDRSELEVLAHSRRSGLRQLACEAIVHCDLLEEIDLVMPLINDSHRNVRAAALKTLGFLRAEGDLENIYGLALHSLDPTVGVTAGWVSLLSGYEAGLSRWLQHDDPEVRTFAAAAVSASGAYGIPLAKRALETSSDPYVRVNLALALIGQREECELACEILDSFLRTHDERLMFNEEGLFHALQKSDVSYNPMIPNFPEAVDQTVRLELLNLLAILEYPGVQESIKAFLKKGSWKVTGLAAETLLGEGDETAVDLVRELLEDPDPEVRVEAALVLASWGRDPMALPTLLGAYEEGDRTLKIKILEVLGRIGDKKAIPFLVERLKEPSMMFRMIAASILLQTLNH